MNINNVRTAESVKSVFPESLLFGDFGVDRVSGRVVGDCAVEHGVEEGGGGG